ncbi:hypothetical protein D0T53_10240 [Dysgonomonas sp. 216]|uniref:hypothetical protein n=1 Tax=Dysgonomonas sp. 216 TaxID=2302934 RepID=UPI0013D85CFB|nr:hypothetical protein [Dysgonomonas sp. 216]NDW19290.1 hypothetical protein [Dysgonomonas sp. 216]
MANTKEIKQIIESNRENLAFIIGNGINRYPDNPKALSWDDLLMELWKKVSSQTLKQKPQGISITEFYDILELEKRNNYNLQKEVVKLLQDWEPLPHHKQITDYIKNINAPLLTTNFEETFAKTGNYNMYKTEDKGFTDFYPWTSYHGDKQLEFPTDGFGIWYINGMMNYHRSIRLGLSHYMGSVERTRGLLHKGNEDSLFFSKSANCWRGNKSWLHIIFNKSLFIFGIGLEENEVFLRWLLIERTKYFRKFDDRKQNGWYLTPKCCNDTDLGKKFFLEKVGIEVLEVDCFSDIYENMWT